VLAATSSSLGIHQPTYCLHPLCFGWALEQACRHKGLGASITNSSTCTVSAGEMVWPYSPYTQGLNNSVPGNYGYSHWCRRVFDWDPNYASDNYANCAQTTYANDDNWRCAQLQLHIFIALPAVLLYGADVWC
jgi:hypothetical protein